MALQVLQVVVVGAHQVHRPGAEADDAGARREGDLGDHGAEAVEDVVAAHRVGGGAVAGEERVVAMDEAFTDERAPACGEGGHHGGLGGLGRLRGEDRREKRQDERDTFGRGGTATRYVMRQKLVSIGDDYWIEDDAGDRAFHVDDANVADLRKLEDTLDAVAFGLSTGTLVISDREES